MHRGHSPFGVAGEHRQRIEYPRSSAADCFFQVKGEIVWSPHPDPLPAGEGALQKVPGKTYLTKYQEVALSASGCCRAGGYRVLCCVLRCGLLRKRGGAEAT